MANSSDTHTMEVLEAEFHQNKAMVIDLLIKNCMTVDTSIPRVVRGKFGEEEN